ncbi:hypothetical protein OG871_28765 [Kitasatospora sp. NBC_00374]|uniref:hypothetical protein n=1 Tax=Kitasatospora sp. NBC_00374 TaxID=2975964 RepID=UPI0030DE6403
MSDQHTPQAGRLLIGLYPARYRAAHGEDIAATFAEAAEGLSRRAVLRERLDLASHALRLRLRIGATDPAGRVLAGAVPVVLGLLAGFCMWVLLPELRELAYRVRHPYPNLGLRVAVQSVLYAMAAYLPWVLVLVAVAVGRWRLARALALVATLLWAALSVVFGPWTQLLYGGVTQWAVLCAVVLLAPPTLLDRSVRGRWKVTAVALSYATLLIVSHRTDLYGYFSGTTLLNVYVCWPLLAAAAVLLGHLAARRPDRLRAAGAGLVGLVWLLPGLLEGSSWLPRVGRMLTAYLVLVGLMVALAAGVRMIRRVRGAEPADPA